MLQAGSAEVLYLSAAGLRVRTSGATALGSIKTADDEFTRAVVEDQAL